MTPVRLSLATLATLGPHVRSPRFDPSIVTLGIVHLGLGGFHRAHMARYTHDLMELDPLACEWGIVGAGLLPEDRGMQDALAPQDFLYTHFERDGSEEAATVVGAIREVILAADDPSALLEAIDRPGVRIVSLTVTENGYLLDRATKRLALDHPMIIADLADPRAPHSAVGLITEAYRRRREAGRRPFTALSCDNIQHNGDVLRRATLDYAAVSDADLAGWIERAASFPNTMVDRITPATTAADLAELGERYGVADRWPVVSETFHQWVIEDDFVDGRPAWEKVGVQFTTDVAPYEFMKLRLLNASHLAIAGLGRLIGYEFIHQTMDDARLRAYMVALMDRETAPTLKPVPGIDLAQYQSTLVERFANPTIRDTVERVNTDAPLNVLLDPIRDRLERGEEVELLALALAAWLRRVRGTDERGEPIDVRHPLAAELRERAVAGGSDARRLLELRSLFGGLVDDDAFVRTVTAWLGSIYAIGSAGTLDRARSSLGF